MTNRYRGEVEITLDGRCWSMVLTLGALAELEGAYAADNLDDLLARFTTGRLSAHDIQRLLLAGLKGAGHDVDADQLARMHCPQGVVGMAQAVKHLLEATFAPQEAGTASVATSPSKAKGHSDTTHHPAMARHP
ncbi:gene transfer agent family protein [Pseudovibrio exalbescens]|uniref:Phage tail tube protein, GTA-gp10 n=1 Tax=Pseudovibrio exalbescens TaxID=197461 RepID=A0A1U7JET0_9HYPH|nr:gene transfer agent family protein [Pseudovibrio exalbescens]OKL43198.1 hypothetical protein A3843_15950 [Pseudovibrio exalbescens]